MIYTNSTWDLSDQPKVLLKDEKKLLRKGNILNTIKLLTINILYFPYLFIKFIINNSTNNINNIAIDSSFYGICVNLDKGDIQYELVEELGVKSLQIRVYLSDIKNINDYVSFADRFKNKDILINIIQSREHIKNKKLLQNDIKIIFQAFQNISSEFIIGHTINRIKWGFININEYLIFYKTVQDIRDKYFKDYKLIGSSVIDFEYHFIIATLFNNFNIKYDKIASLLYVDRRGSPHSKQMKIFDLKNKINFLYTIVSSSKKSSNDIYITETNWPLQGTAPYAPTSENECVSEKLYIKYMKEYYHIAKKTSKIQKVYWHQLVAIGYGLVDNRDDKIRKTKAFYAFKDMIKNAK
jgi:hypothetical protein